MGKGQFWLHRPIRIMRATDSGKSLARELAAHGILVNAIAPGLIDTPMGNATGEYGVKGYLERCPLGRMGQPEDIANLAVFLGSAASNYITGQAWNVCGGYLMA